MKQRIFENKHRDFWKLLEDLFKKKIKHFTAAVFIIIIFVDFNSVLFRQYMTWVSPLVLLALCETFISSKDNKVAKP